MTPQPSATWHRGATTVRFVMGLTGRITKGGQPLVEGKFTAEVDGAFCGWGQIYPDGTYRLAVARSSTGSDNCDRVGSTVYFVLDGARAPETIELVVTTPERRITLDLHFP